MKNLQNENSMRNSDIQNKTNKTHLQQMSQGYLTIINQNSILQKLKSEDNKYLIDFPLEKSRDAVQDNYPLNMNKYKKKQIKLIKIMAIKQRRSEFKEITNNSFTQIAQNNNNNIEIVSRIYDNMSNEFERMYKYYGLISINDINFDQSYQACPYSAFQKRFQTRQLQQQSQNQDQQNQLRMKTEDSDLISQSSQLLESDSSFSPNIRKQIKKQKHIPSGFQRKYQEGKSPLLRKQYSNISEYDTPRNSQNLKQSSKDRQIQYDSTSSDLNDNNRRLVQKSLKIITDKAFVDDEQQKQDEFNKSSRNQIKKQQKLYSGVDQNDKQNNLQPRTDIPSQQNFISQFEKLQNIQQQVRNYEKQDKVYEQLQLLIVNPNSFYKNSLENTLSILQKCIYITQASHVHSIISNLIQDFGTFSETNTQDNDLQNLTEQKDEEESATGQKQKDASFFRLSCRANTSLSRNSMTTQPLSCKVQSTPSISNITSSACINNIENIKIELIGESNLNKEKIQDIKQNQFGCLTEQQESIKLISEKKQDEDKLQGKEKIPHNLLSSQNKQSYVYNYKSFFKLNRLTSQQLNQFKFSQYKKKNSSNLSQICAGSSPKFNSDQNKSDDTKSVSKFGKFHNYNKLFMYNVLNMFQPNNLAHMNIPEFISKELQLLISRIKISAKNNYKVEGKYAFDYFSHAHYNVLFLQLTPENIGHLSQQEEYVSLYKTCFNLDLTEQISQITLTYTNIIKVYCYQIFIECIKEEDIKVDNTLNQENLKNQYTLKVIKGVKKLSQGLIIKRF